MPRTLPPSSAPAALETIEEHLRISRRWIGQAEASFPGLLTEDALVLFLKGGKLDASTVGRYRADLKYGLTEHMTALGRMSDFAIAWKKVNDALTERKGVIPKSDWRTSALKIDDPTEDEVRALFRELKRHSIKHGNPNAILAALFVLVAGHTGFRPIELRGAVLVDTVLSLPNAKKRPGHNEVRTMNLADLDSNVLTGLRLMLNLIDNGLTKREFASWEKVLAGQIRRACIRIGIRILAPYSFRHVAIASWSAAGLPPEEIARLCGHLSIRTAHAHYARAAKGHKRNAVARSVPAVPTETSTPGPGDAAAEMDLPVSTGPGSNGHEATATLFESMPRPIQKLDRSRVTMEGAEALRHFERYWDKRDPAEIAENIARARAAKQMVRGPDDRDEDEPQVER